MSGIAQSLRTWIGAGVLAGAAALLGGCIPSRVVIDLSGADGRLEATKVMADPDATGFSSKVALIDISGVIAETPMPGLFQSRANSVDSLVARLQMAEEDDAVKAVVLRINSPGGTVGASETMHREIEAFRERTGKPVVVSMAEIATSGGYYVALASDWIIAQPSSVTGSIGVLMQTFNFSRGMEMIGIEGRALTSRPNKDLANPFEAPEEAHFAILQGIVDEFYTRFRGQVQMKRWSKIESRGFSFDELTDGRVFTGEQAAMNGLVDGVGTLRDAFAVAKDLADVPSAQLIKYHSEGVRLNSPYAVADVLPRAGGAGEESGAVREINLIQFTLPDGSAAGAGFYYLWSPGGSR